ncbi:hypothetical protein [Persicobacter psychrovividus]|uniref:DUF1854 domain-containing protein n=1 Tax=Persicobacter psychrovividus TaxID=387638 RepID=A0ABM7VDC0_9BACT|nr:hypothetical protein PEPS_12280 [Persicobacter psychrovividus]
MEIRRNRDWKNKVWQIEGKGETALILSMKEQQLLKSLMQAGNLNPGHCFLLVNEVGLLNIYFENIPETAYDIVEFTEKPVALIMPEARNVPEDLLAKKKTLQAMFMKKNHFNELAMVQQPLIAIVLPEQAKDLKWLQQQDNVLILQDQNIRFPFRMRTVAHDASGDIKITDH